MNKDSILEMVPDADPEFLATMARLPEPPPDMRDKIAEALPKLHDLFLRKREAAQRGDQDEFMRLAEKEIEEMAEL